MPTTVRFIYSKSNATVLGGVMQTHDQVQDFTVSADPLNYSGLREAERNFLTWFARTYPGEDLIRWRAAYADGQGRYSEYRAYLPVTS